MTQNVQNTRGRRAKPTSVSVKQAVEHYLTALKLEGKSGETILWYQKKLKAFIRFMESRAGAADIAALALEDGREFVRSLMERRTMYDDHVFRRQMDGGLAPRTVHGYVRAIRALATWLWEEGYLADNLFKPIKPPKVPKTLQQPLTEEEIRRLLDSIRQNSPEGARNYAVVALFVDCGLRLSELVQLAVADVDLSLGEIRVHGKGGKERRVPVGLTARKAVARYLTQFRPEPAAPAEQRLFLTVAGLPITQNTVEKVMQRLAKRTGISRLHPHLLRHTAAVRYITNGGDAFSLQRILGHETLEVTRQYVELASADVAQKHRLFSPIDNLSLSDRRPGRPRRV